MGENQYYCGGCGHPYPASGLPAYCPDCGGKWVCGPLKFSPAGAEQNGIWRHRASFGSYGPVTYLGEGSTPLVPLSGVDGVYFKCEHLNPSGSFKDRGTALLVSELCQRGIKTVVEDSSGNAGASLALYSKAFGITSRIYVPESTSGPKRQQITRAGAEVVPVPGAREAAHQAVEKAVSEEGLPYASHALQPFHLAAYAGIIYEIYEDLGQLPGTVVAPAGHGSLFLGTLLGSRSLETYLDRPRNISHVGVQPANCAPIARAWQGQSFAGSQGKSIAEGTQVESPARLDEIIAALDRNRDTVYTLREDEIQIAWQQLLQQGFYVEPTSAMVWAAYRAFGSEWPKPVVLILSGSGLKYA